MCVCVLVLRFEALVRVVGFCEYYPKVAAAPELAPTMYLELLLPGSMQLCIEVRMWGTTGGQQHTRIETTSGVSPGYKLLGKSQA